MSLTAGDRRGFSLVEVVVAMAVLACVVATSTMVLTNARSAQRRAERRDIARIAVQNEIEMLRSLPFFVAPAPMRPGRADAVGHVFPHALAALNSASAMYCAHDCDDGPAGSFVTSRVTDAGLLKTTAVFVTSTRDGWARVPPAAVEGFAADDSPYPPGAALRVTVACSRATAVDDLAFSASVVLVARPEALSVLGPPSSTVWR
jgi:prepilin-type N-terminal cleavage/methylation domain-containing protein